ncbi:DUF2637 domain-containing protein [Peterkaempfera sp. SMS 1(5)a]|uniref:DUF2637 domain-containing protein n=1 Tax=Peterkaempfera podocarpi TaxID=3232308 RepID=UPI00366E05BF
MKILTTTRRGLSSPIRLAWFLVLAMMLAAAAWSISHQLIGWGMAPWLAYGLSLMFDAAGLICAEYARRAVERNTPAGLPRLATVGFVAVSGVLNYNHGYTIAGLPAAAGLASVSAAVELLFELHRRDVRDEQRAERGLVAERLPHIPVIGWLMYPVRSWRTLREAVGVRLDNLDPMSAVTTPVTSVIARTDAPVTAPVAAPVTPVLQAAPAAAPVSLPAEPAPVAAAPVQPQPGPTLAALPLYTGPDAAALTAIRTLYVTGFRPGTQQMQEAVFQATGVRPSGATCRGNYRKQIEAVEPGLAQLPAAPTTLRTA